MVTNYWPELKIICRMSDELTFWPIIRTLIFAKIEIDTFFLKIGEKFSISMNNKNFGEKSNLSWIIKFLVKNKIFSEK